MTQMVGWATTFHVPAALSGQIETGTGLSSATIFGGVTLMLIVAAMISPLVGRLLDRDGARRWMVLGSLLTAAGLVVMSQANGIVLFGVAWLLFGLAMPLALNQGASTALVQIAPDSARGAIAVLLLLTGLSSTFAWPVLIRLDAALGWRTTLLVCAGAQVVICAFLHLVGLPRGRVLAERDPVAPGEGKRVPPAEPPARLFWLAAVTFSLSGMLTWGLPLHMLGILRDFGHPEAAAVAIGALLGPGQVLARAFEMLGGRRIGILTVGVGSAVLMPLSLAAFLLWGGTTAGAVAFTVGYGLSAGISSIVRAVAPLRLFGAHAYARILGRLGLPQNMAFAAAPLGFAVIRQHFGSGTVIAVAFAIGLVCLVTMAMLARDGGNEAS